jgi:dinuclear metal center YbgI/SA1388 family protein
MLDHDIGLISYHLPLDAHAEYGNNIRILKTLKAEHCIPFGYYKGFPIGYQGELKKPEPIESITRALGVNDFHYINGGKKEIKTIAVVSGGGTSCFEEAVQKKADLFITGDRSHEIYHSALENGINVLFAGHYFTETFGVESLIPILEKEFKVHTIFFDIPTNL